MRALRLRLITVDERALAWIAAWRSRPLCLAFRAVTHTGDWPVVVVALASALLWLRSAATLQLALAAAVGLALFSAAKRISRRARPTPFALLRCPDEFSMPSGHATIAWAVGMTAAWTLPGAAVVAIPWALGVSVSRVVLGVHYPLDVAVGAVLGALSALAAALLCG